MTGGQTAVLFDISALFPRIVVEPPLVKTIVGCNLVISMGVTNTTPATPTGVPDDAANTLTLSHALGLSELLLSTNSGAYVALPSLVINVGNVARAAGYYKVKVKAATGRNESGVYESPAFTVPLPTPAAPTFVSYNDATNEYTFAPPAGYTATQCGYVLNGNGPVACTSATITVGNVVVPAGNLKVFVLAAAGVNNAGEQLGNAAPFTKVWDNTLTGAGDANGVGLAAEAGVQLRYDTVGSGASLPSNMAVSVNGTSVGSVDFLSRYTGQPFALTYSGTTYSGVFTSGAVNLS